MMQILLTQCHINNVCGLRPACGKNGSRFTSHFLPVVATLLLGYFCQDAHSTVAASTQFAANSIQDHQLMALLPDDLNLTGRPSHTELGTFQFLEGADGCALHLIQKAASVRLKVRRQDVPKSFRMATMSPVVAASGHHEPCVLNGSSLNGTSPSFSAGLFSWPSDARGSGSFGVGRPDTRSTDEASSVKPKQMKASAAIDHDTFADEWISNMLSLVETSNTSAIGSWPHGQSEQSIPLANFSLLPVTRWLANPAKPVEKMMLGGLITNSSKKTSTGAATTSSLNSSSSGHGSDAEVTGQRHVLECCYTLPSWAPEWLVAFCCNDDIRVPVRPIAAITPSGPWFLHRKARVAKRSAIFPAASRCGSLQTPQLQMMLDMLSAAGHFPKRPSCGPQELASAWLGEASAFSMMSESGSVEHKLFVEHWSKSAVFYIILVWAVLYAIYLLRLFGGIILQRFEAEQASLAQKRVSSGEWRAWHESFFAWASASWITKLVVSLPGRPHADVSKEELGPVSFLDDASQSCHSVFRVLWEHEVQERGLHDASLKRVLLRYVGWQKVVLVFALTIFLEFLKRIVALVLADIFLGYLTWMSEQQHRHPNEQIELTLPIAVAILTYTIVPLVIVIFDNAKNQIDERIDMRVEAALAMMVYEKAQRLPAGIASSDQKDAQEEGLQDVVQLVAIDIKRNLNKFTRAAIFLCFCPVTTIFMFGLMCKHLRWAAPVSLLTMIPISYLTAFFSGLNQRMQIALQACVDQRLTLLQEMFASMRIVKSYGWEEAHEEQLLEVRRSELSHLYWFLGAIAGIITTMVNSTRIIHVSGLAVYVLLYGSIHAHTIFISIQISGVLTASSNLVLGALPLCIMGVTSLHRVERYLRQEELPEHDLCQLSSGKAAPATLALAEPSPVIRVRGSFCCQAQMEPVLHDLKLDVQQGSFVAVVGEVGSGKSLLLQTILGELIPVDSASVETCSRKIAYCAEVPFIMQGSLRENILLGHDAVVDEERYLGVLAAAALQPDIEVWPGGDAVPIGGRGITLSGGQKVRTALARAAYSSEELVLMDNPFGAVDACTSQVLLEQLCKGPFMRHRTRIAVVQPEPDKLMAFDEVIVLVRGRIALRGAPAQVVQSEAFKSLLSSSQKNGGKSVQKQDEKEKLPVCTKPLHHTPGKLIDEECRGRVDWQTIRFWAELGKPSLLVVCLLLMFVSYISTLFGDIQIVNWANDNALEHKAASDTVYLMGCLFWITLGILLFALAFAVGVSYSVALSDAIFVQVLKSTTQAPLMFFDKTPLGRIIARFSTDLGNIDQQLFIKINCTCGFLMYCTVLLCYVHRNMPLIFALLAVSFYVVVAWLTKQWLFTSFQLLYLERTLTSDLSGHLTEVKDSRVSVRALGHSGLFRDKFAQVLDHQLTAQFLNNTVMTNWFQLRVISLMSFLITQVALIGLTHTRHFGAGTVAFCLSSMSSIIDVLPGWLQEPSKAQFYMISIKRLQEYTMLPKEKPAVMDGDHQISSRWVTIPRETLRHVKVLLPRAGDPLQAVCPDGSVLFQATADGCALEPSPANLVAAARGSEPRALEPSPANRLLAVSRAHRITSVNYKSGDAATMMAELCGAAGSSTLVRLYLEGSWLRKGARVQVEKLVAGYSPSVDTLHGISMDIQARQRVAIVGATGSGKSTLMLAMLRLLEPRRGRILIDGRDTTTLGLQTLRQAIGLVPQDPVLFSGTIRQNLDPFGWYTDEQVWWAFKCVQMADFVENLPRQLEQTIQACGENLSFGQRQLVCLARMVLRQPKLLLFDEATSMLDPRTQEMVGTTLRSVFLDSTIVSVAHRLDTVLDCDVVFVMERGHIVEKGSPTSLRSMTEGLFSKMLAASHRRSK